jgi:hypothetical protein
MIVNHLPQKPDTQLLTYQTESGDTKIEVRLFIDISKQDAPGSLRGVPLYPIGFTLDKYSL